MELNNFEKHLRTSLHDMEEEVDVTKLMKGIPLIKPAKKRRGFILPSIAILAFVMVGSAMFFYNDSNTLVDHNSQQVTSSELAMNDQIVNLEAAEDNSNVETITTKSALVSSSSINTNTTINQTKKKHTISSAISSSENSKTTNQYKTIDNQSSAIQNDGKSSNSEEIIDQSSSVALAYQSSNSYSKSTKNTADFVSKRELVTQTTNLKSLNPQNIITNEDFYAALLTPKHVNCPTFAENPWIFDFGMVMGLSKPSKTLSSKTTGIQPAYTSRATNEKSLEGLDLELFLSAKRARWPVSLKSGLNYSRWSERMKIEEDYSEIDTIQGLISVTTSQTGDTVKYIYGDIYVEREVQIRKSIHYYINRIDVPLSVVFEKEFSGHGFQIEAGTRVNVATFARGLIYNSQSEFTNVSSSPFFRKITGLSYFGKLHYRYYVSPSNYIGAQAYYQYLPAEFSDKTNQISQKYTNYGLGLYYGMRF